ncbi:hypothetical protein V6M85_13160 [Sulfolobus tengchongensis]|uniref:Uncharacterized protein n=1 Tax=Sulfolobus tengchongensis TaxID=207809 RepID=A0AAX4L012_9CREN
MSVQTLKPVNRGVNGISEKDLIFLIEALDRKERKLIFEKFSEDFKEVLTRAAMYKLTRGDTHLKNERILWLIENNEEAKKFVLDLLKKKAQRMLEIIEKLEAEEEEGEEE